MNPGARRRAARPRRAAAAIVVRTGVALATALAASALVWGLLQLAPGDPARRYLKARNVESPTTAQLVAIRSELGLDKPLVIRYVNWLGDAARGDLSTSYVSDLPVRQELARRFPATARLALATLLLAVVLALLLGVISALYAGRLPDALVRAGAAFAAATPSFLLGLLFIEILAVKWGFGRVIADGTWATVWMPAAAIAPFAVAIWARLLRAGILDALASGYALVASARGSTRLRVILVHGLPAAAIPFLNAVGLTLGYLIGGDVVIETVFSWPGLGSYIANAVAFRDLPVVQAFALLVTLGWVLISLLVDVASRLVDPRLRARRAT